MIVVVPMAGHGTRFRQGGWSMPKPLIPVHGKPMYAWATDSLPLQHAKRLVFVCLDEHLVDHGLGTDIEERYGERLPTEIVGIPAVTEGQLCTVLKAQRWVDTDDSVIVYNADTWCRTDLDDSLPEIEGCCDGFLGVFEADGDHWSFARLDDDGRVVQTAEKRRISPWATTGLYHFSSGGRFVAAAHEAVARNRRERGEFYVAPLYNDLIAGGAEIRVNVAIEVGVMGTPDELTAFVARD